MTRQIYILDQHLGAVLSIREDGSGLTVLVDRCPHPDGIVVDGSAGHLYWTNMGPTFDEPCGSIERARLDGSERTMILAEGLTHTPKQLRLDAAERKIYWCDREGMRVMRANMDGTEIETLVITGDPEANRGDATRWCVGIALDLVRRQVYWTQKGPPGGGLGRISRTSMDRPNESDAEHQIEILIENLPEPVDLELSEKGDSLCWTDRSQGSGGGSLNRVRVDPASGAIGMPQLVVAEMDEPIGLALNADEDRMFVADLGGSVHVGDIERGQWNRLLSNAGRFTGICVL
ncbi:3-hydroxyacyl-CoA dehydrogenase [Dyella sp. C11]|uniref:3-hydroxyacyl-CoA dehydrogenase n=1 Tax=Dyella sp. C11 TaxID=2126991 RepID=UPI000D65A2B6|nr:3-hydroxyacyl-CoA dehydrogenase [Dyella sp. C11]